MISPLRVLILCTAIAVVGCSTTKRIMDPKPTIITDNSGTTDPKDDQIITVKMQSDAHLKYTKTKDGYTLDIDNRGAKSFARATAETLVDKTDILVGSNAERIVRPN